MDRGFKRGHVMASGLPALISDGPHYPRPIERSADRWVHLVGLTGGGVGGLVLLGVSLGVGRLGQTTAVGIYATCLILMFLASAAYNMASPRRRPLLRRLDHAAIFLMIAGSYTPFTTQRLVGPWAIGMTAQVWGIALAGIIGKLAFPKISERIWTAIYVMFGWLAVLALRPLSQSLSVGALGLLAAGGLSYTAGSLVFLNARLPFRRAIWHGFVCTGAAMHFGAIAGGVVLMS